MEPEKQPASNEKKPKRRFNWEIYYVEKIGNRYVLRFGHMFWVLIALGLIGFLIAVIFDSTRR